LNATVGHDVTIEDFVNIAPGAHISGNVWIKQGCWIGTGAVINQGANEKKLSIGAQTTIGSGSVVIKDCDEHAVYVGSPARRIK
jgi:acetyltransferase-like isoleucine patch superfamily enzyme